jgi:hypothetical protein
LNIYSLALQSSDPAFFLLGYGYLPYFIGPVPQVGPFDGPPMQVAVDVTST